MDARDNIIRKKPKTLRLFKLFFGIVFVALIFAGGYRVGHGDWEWRNTSQSASSQPGGLSYSSLDQVYSVLKDNFNGTLDTNKLLNGAKAGLVEAAGDPYTEFFDPAAAKSFNDQLSNSITGIGAELGKNGSDIIIMSPLTGYPADRAGLLAKDIIAAVDGKVVSGMEISSVVRLIRGEAGTKVTLTIIRDSKQLKFTITREKISLPDVNSKMIGKIGYMQVIQFSNNTVAEATKAAKSFKASGAKAVILDLRNNPGGYLQGAVDLSSLWLKQGQVVVEERRGSQVVETLYAGGNNILGDLPTIVLINGGSASASEITAAALHDNKKASLLGTTSFGKGSVQQLQTLNDGSELKVTVALWYTPAGININKKGIKPDVVVQPATNQTGSLSDPQKDKAVSLLNAKL